MSKIHWIEDCGFGGYFSTYTKIKSEVTCSRCVSKYKINIQTKAYVVKRGSYLNIVEAGFLEKNMEIISTLQYSKLKSHIN